MKLKVKSPKDAVKSDKQTVEKSSITTLRKAVNILIEKLDNNTKAKKEHAERVGIMSFLKSIDYTDNDFAYEDEGIDLAIKSNDKFGVIFETKSSLETKDMISHDNLNVKPMQQVIFYYLQQRTSGNNEIKHIIVTNGYDWYIFDAHDFDRIYYRDNKFLKDFKEHQSGAKSGKSTDNFYKEIAQAFIENSDAELKAVYFNLKEYTKANDPDLNALYKLLRSDFLLKKKKQIDSNKLNTKFFKELLYIMGLEEQKEGSKKLIREKAQPDEGSLLENLKAKIESHGVLDDFQEIEKYGETYTEQLFNISLELVLTWINRLLFLKLLEGQLVDYHKTDSNKYKFLNHKKVDEFDILDALFFEVLNVPVENRKEKIKERYPNIPYLNSSLFEPSALEKKIAFISAMKDNLTLPLYSQTVLTNETVKELPTLEYLLKFMGAYNFASHTEDDVYTEKGELINASVLGLVFEKINGYKEGSFYTPGFITEYMARETIRKAVIQKFNDAYKTDISDFDELRNYTISNAYKKDKIIEYNKLINSLKIVDPAVGSGHFLVSSLNEILSIKSELGILADEQGNKLACKIEIENDTAIINDTENKLFRYSLNEENNIIQDKNKIQSGIFHEKKSIIENCLFGVDINLNSVKICRLRLWIELLKNAYYKPENIRLETLPNIDINIKEGNSLISRFPLYADIKKALKKSKWDIASYQNAVKTYHEATNKTQKREMLKLIETIKNDFETEISTNDKRYLKLNKLKGELFQIQNQGGLFEMSKAEKDKWNKEVTKLTSEIQKLETELEDIKNNVIYRNAFEWRFEFPEVLDDDGTFVGFDIVIGNPPYIPVGVFNTSSKNYFLNNYDYVERKYETSVLFMILGLRILTNKSNLSYIAPLTWQTGENYTIFREKLFTSWGVKQIINLPFDIFADAFVDTAIYFLTNTPSEKYDICSFGKKENHKELKNVKFNSIKKELILKPKFKVILNPLVFRVIQRLDTNKYEKLGDISISTQGLSPSRFPEVTETNSNLCFPYLKTGNVYNYNLIIQETYITSLEGIESLAPYYEKKEKILIRRIINRQDRLSVAYTDEKLVFKKDINPFIINNENYLTKYVLAILASKFISYYYINVSAIALKDDFRQTTLTELRDVQIPFIKKDKQEKIVNVVNQILTLKKANPEADTSQLEDEIDKMVYELYGLTAEEIQIIEESVK